MFLKNLTGGNDLIINSSIGTRSSRTYGVCRSVSLRN